MEIDDGCLSLKVPVIRRKTSRNILPGSFSVSYIQEYLIVVTFHSYKHQVFRRYREFRSFRESVSFT